ncbi:YcgN family cysteine cluster protein [Mariprofundus erugo]|uniref:YcgN family cysteine cluster protein n=1 Tax=Mariprofundus erugo TaxID=2528639 RepID=A0A5R9GT60_9PROT|nr:YcgN family cysteine cluster protein [Mariprofundus erugo]TLS68245.1 YcgN family cysteine cluster protein [Mariprofundus erugo]TLS77101.1 YcgN family cysteine cluster protein [Mariprofundus erugo]
MFWEEKSLKEMTNEEWDSLCDGCGRCCVWKFEDEDSGEILYTDIRCRLFNDNTCRCTDYQNRTTLIPDCMDTRTLTDKQYSWLPDTCAYRLLHEGKPLFDWHPLITGDKDSVHKAGISVRKKTVCGDNLSEDDIMDHIIDPDA